MLKWKNMVGEFNKKRWQNRKTQLQKFLPEKKRTEGRAPLISKVSKMVAAYFLQSNEML